MHGSAGEWSPLVTSSDSSPLMVSVVQPAAAKRAISSSWGLIRIGVSYQVGISYEETLEPLPREKCPRTPETFSRDTVAVVKEEGGLRSLLVRRRPGDPGARRARAHHRDGRR